MGERREKGVIYAEVEEMIDRADKGGRERKQTGSVIYAELFASAGLCVRRRTMKHTVGPETQCSENDVEHTARGPG